jgi:hypothetical protein
MTLGRLFALLIVLVLGWWVVTKSGLLAKHEPEADASQAPIERAREVSRKSTERNVARQGAQNEADSASSAAGGSVTENMTPDQVRALLGTPSETRLETTESGTRRETWIYHSVGKTVVFENGVAVSIQ